MTPEEGNRGTTVVSGGGLYLKPQRSLGALIAIGGNCEVDMEYFVRR